MINLLGGLYFCNWPMRVLIVYTTHLTVMEVSSRAPCPSEVFVATAIACSASRFSPAKLVNVNNFSLARTLCCSNFDLLARCEPFGTANNHPIAGFDAIPDANPQTDHGLYIGRDFFGDSRFIDRINE